MTDSIEQPFFDPSPVDGNASQVDQNGSTLWMATQPDMWKSSPVIEWLILDAWRLNSVEDLTEQLAEHLVAAGIPLYRLFLMVPFLHPLYVGSGYIWRRGGDGVELSYGEHGARDRPEFQDNPLRFIIDDGYSAIRRTVGETYVEGEFGLVDNLVAEGATDYVSLAIEFTNGKRAAISFTSDHKDGFSAENMVELNNLLPVVARLVERSNLEQTIINILDAYVGHTAGERILKGQITRGSRDTIFAAIWFCDLRQFTKLSDRLPRDEMIALLNSFFETMAEPVLKHGGEVMKFIGDAMLAVFPVASQEDCNEVCKNVIAAATEAVEGMEKLNEQRMMFGQNKIDYGLACHIGEVAYGNIGAVGRLDFTVIGPAVNYSERLEQLCKQVPNRPILSQDFVDRCTQPTEKLGDFPLRGLDGDHAIYGLIDAETTDEPTAAALALNGGGDQRPAT